jgi:hypothetical protein
MLWWISGGRREQVEQVRDEGGGLPLALKTNK